MNLAAIDIGTNSIHMIIVKVTSQRTFEILLQEKEMVKLGVGVFSNKEINPGAFALGIDTITRYVQLADKFGVDEIITAATSATREAKNGRDFLDRIIHEVGVIPQLISGKEEARLIFLAVKRAIDIGKDNALVLDIGGGSTEAVVGNQTEVIFKSSIKLGVLRLLDAVGHTGKMKKTELESIRNQIAGKANKTLSSAKYVGYKKVIGTSGTIRSFGEAIMNKMGKQIINSVNAEVIHKEDLDYLVHSLLKKDQDERSKIVGIGTSRSDAIHLGGVLLSTLLELIDAKEITLCDASLREGLIIDYLEKNVQKHSIVRSGVTLKEKSCLQLSIRYDTDIESKKHVAFLGLKVFDQLRSLHQMDDHFRELLYHASLIYDIGLFINFENYHKHSEYLILNGRLRGFNNEELIMLALLARYHRKSGPKKKHKKVKQLFKYQRKGLMMLAGILRLAVGLDKTKNQWVEDLSCNIAADNITIYAISDENIDMEIWEAQRYADTLLKVLKRPVIIAHSLPA
ncbi:Ppx/GppA phosphatase family protein [Anditalea andensis]|uniref:Phosphatase n=1 Tax=Anditalea andensis TaxID=1048983 RepID=A0A074L3K4_9BACT|nr:Ppx/GppA phosphatase family protein [Anditalea andensis]KEO75754.1 phosphatase [Anditalea andensis]